MTRSHWVRVVGDDHFPPVRAPGSERNQVTCLVGWCLHECCCQNLCAFGCTYLLCGPPSLTVAYARVPSFVTTPDAIVDPAPPASFIPCPLRHYPQVCATCCVCQRS